MVAISLLQSSNLFSLNRVTMSLVRAPKSMMEVEEAIVDIVCG